MDFEEGLAVTQERLADEADSLAELLGRLRRFIAPALVGDREWDALLEPARHLPATMAAFPFGFELPLHDRRPRADLGISLVGGTGPAMYFEDRARSGEADRSAAGIARILRETEPDRSPLRQVIGRKMMLEYDIGPAAGDARPEPGIFLRPAERPIVGSAGQVGDVGVVLDALVAALGWRPDGAEKRSAERVYLAQPPGTRIDSFGAFPSRERAIRLAVTGFGNSSDIASFLERAGWTGPGATVASAISRFEERGGFVSLGVHLDVLSGGLGPTLGLSVLAKERVAKDPGYWLDRPQLWKTFVEGLRVEDLVVPEKLSALAGWCARPTTLFARSGQFVLLRGIHHFKIVLDRGRPEQVKGYAFMVLIATPNS